MSDTINQMEFCKNLMLRLCIDIEDREYMKLKINALGGNGCDGRTRIQDDIKRLRRELTILSKTMGVGGVNK